MKKIMYVLAILVVLMVVVGCSNGVFKDEYNNIVAELNAAKTEISALSGEIEGLKSSIAEMEKEHEEKLNAIEEKLKEKAKEEPAEEKVETPKKEESKAEQPKVEAVPQQKPAEVKPKVITIEGVLSALQEQSPYVTDILIFDETTDPNENLGRPGKYIAKGDFFDDRTEDSDDNAGTIELFVNQSDCNNRYNYLCKLANSDLGVFGVEQYIYKYKLAVFRVSFDLTPSQAKEYKTIMDGIMGEVSTQFAG